MSEISLQAGQFFPRLAVIVILLAITWLLARFTKQLVLRATSECQGQIGGRTNMTKLVANGSLGFVWLLMLPFIINAAGFSTNWLSTVQQLEAQVFVNWPLWIVISFLVSGIAFLVREVPKFFDQLKVTVNEYRGELQS